MAITTYGTLKTAVANWLHDSTLTSRIPEFVSLAEDVLYTDPAFRLRFMETSSDITITQSTQTTALPTRYVRARRIYIAGYAPMKYLAPFDFWEKFQDESTGRPTHFTIEGENFTWGPVPDATYTGKCLFWQRPAALSADSDTNWVLTNARGLLLYGTLLQAAPYLEDDAKTVTWASLYQDLFDKVVAGDKDDRHSGSPQQMRPASSHLGP